MALSQRREANSSLPGAFMEALIDLLWGSLHHLNISLTHLWLYRPFPNQVIRLGIQSLTGSKASKLASNFCNLPSFFLLHLNPLLSRLIESCGPAAVWEPLAGPPSPLAGPPAGPWALQPPPAASKTPAAPTATAH